MKRLNTTTDLLNEAVRLTARMKEATSPLQLSQVMTDRRELQETIDGALETGYFKEGARDELKAAQTLLGRPMDQLYFENQKRITQQRRGLLAPHIKGEWI